MWFTQLLRNSNLLGRNCASLRDTSSQLLIHRCLTGCSCWKKCSLKKVNSQSRKRNDLLALHQECSYSQLFLKVCHYSTPYGSGHVCLSSTLKPLSSTGRWFQLMPSSGFFIAQCNLHIPLLFLALRYSVCCAPGSSKRILCPVFFNLNQCPI